MGRDYDALPRPSQRRASDLCPSAERQLRSLTDDGYTIHDLEASGCNLNTEKRQDLLKMTLAGFGVRLNREAIEVRASAENFSLRKHNLIQAMLAVNDLFYLAKPMVESLFFEDVVAW